jgi:flavin-dependent dehydrogenase
VRTRTGTERARYLIDATGQDKLLARQAGTVEPCGRFGTAAIFTHYEGLGDAALAELGPANDIRIVLRADGWGWIIPLPARRLSVGIVSKRRLTPALLDEGLLAGPLARRLTAGARRLETRVIRNFSFRNTAPAGARFAAIGDAACFLDPVFSSGVTLALHGAESVANVLGAALRSGTEADPALLDAHCAHMDRGYRTFAALIDRFYNSRFAESVFLADPAAMPAGPPGADRATADLATAGLATADPAAADSGSMLRGVMSVLAGDVWRHDNPFQEQLLRARQRTGLPL